MSAFGDDPEWQLIDGNLEKRTNSVKSALFQLFP